MVNVRKRGNSYQYCFEIAPVDGKRNVRHSVFDKKKNENGRWYIGTTKTKSGERQIHISQTLMKALVNFKNRQYEIAY